MPIDRAYLSSALVRDRPPAVAIICTAWAVRNGDRLPKTAYVLDWDAGTARCLNQVVVPFQVGHTVPVPPAQCRIGPLPGRRLIT